MKREKKINLATLQSELEKIKKQRANKRKYKYSYWFCVMDANNKMKTLLADIVYELNTRENMLRLERDLNSILNGNYRCLVNFYLIKKFIDKENKNVGQEN